MLAFSWCGQRLFVPPVMLISVTFLMMVHPRRENAIVSTLPLCSLKKIPKAKRGLERPLFLSSSGSQLQ
jgi:hypothetical protein